MAVAAAIEKEASKYTVHERKKKTVRLDARNLINIGKIFWIDTQSCAQTITKRKTL